MTFVKAFSEEERKDTIKLGISTRPSSSAYVATATTTCTSVRVERNIPMAIRAAPKTSVPMKLPKKTIQSVAM